MGQNDESHDNSDSFGFKGKLSCSSKPTVTNLQAYIL